MDRLGIRLRREAGLRQEPGYLGREAQGAPLQTVDQGLHSQPVARQEERAPPPVPQGDREHADETAQEIGPVGQIELQQDLGVARRSEPDAAPLHLFPQLDVIVDLTVPRQDDLAVRAQHRHVPGRRQVEDRQSPARQADARCDVLSRVVGTAVRHRFRHGAERVRVGAPRITIRDAGQAAHSRTSRWGRSWYPPEAQPRGPREIRKGAAPAPSRP